MNLLSSDHYSHPSTTHPGRSGKNLKQHLALQASHASVKILGHESTIRMRLDKAHFTFFKKCIDPQDKCRNFLEGSLFLLINEIIITKFPCSIQKLNTSSQHRTRKTTLRKYLICISPSILQFPLLRVYLQH